MTGPTSYDIAIKRVLRRHPYWGSTDSAPFCACGWGLPDGVPVRLAYVEWTWHVADQVARQVALIDEAGVAASQLQEDIPFEATTP